MKGRWTNQAEMADDVASDDDGGGFCPECGQSLDLARHQEAAVKPRTLEPVVFLVFGLFLAVVFGLRAWGAAAQLSSLDQQIAALRVRAQAVQGILPKPVNPAMIVADTMSEVLTERIDQQVAFQRDVTGLGLGLLTLIVGAVSWSQERTDVVDGAPKQKGPQHIPSSNLLHVRGGPWGLAGLVATTLVRMVLLLFVIIVGLQLIQGSPPSLQLMDQALTRVVAVIVTIARTLS